jgi:pimeloyl-ACP methyl ester carboxylesterase
MALFWTLQRSLIYFPSTAQVPPAGEVIDGARDVKLRTSDGLTLGAWLVPPRGEHSAPGADAARAVTVLVASGNAGDRSYRAPLARALADRGLAVLLFDYRGYGGNPGSPSEHGLGLDVRAARTFLVDELGVPAGRLLYYGESLGSAVVTELATEHPPAGLLLRSPFVDLAAVGQAHYPYLPVRALLRDRYPVSDLLRTVAVPTTVVYGTSDSIVHPKQSVAVAEAAAGRTRVVRVEGADHNDAALLDGRQLVDAVVDLAAEARA